MPVSSYSFNILIRYQERILSFWACLRIASYIFWFRLHSISTTQLNQLISIQHSPCPSQEGNYFKHYPLEGDYRGVFVFNILRLTFCKRSDVRLCKILTSCMSVERKSNWYRGITKCILYRVQCYFVGKWPYKKAWNSS